MNHQKRGLFLLFNQMNFSDTQELDTRLGTDKDATELEILFKSLGFKVQRYNDKKKEEILQILKQGK